MDKNAIKKYAIWARRELIARVSQRALYYGISEKDIGNPNAESVNGKLLSETERKQRSTLIIRMKNKGYEQVIEEVAYTWFNRFAALRFMEVNGYLPSHVRIFTNDDGEFKPQILTEAIHLELDGLNMEKVYELKQANKTEELYKYLLIVQCNALSSILPGMFQKIEDYTELLLPDNLLREGSVKEQMVSMIPENDWTDQVQIIGWLYQYYNTEPKDKVFENLKKNIKISKENIPAATQLFTPDWIVRYMVENSLGRLWLEGHPNDELKAGWKYYLDEAEQEPEVQKQLAEIRKEYAALKPEDIKCIDPCMGSGHILCYMFDVLVKIYEDYGYTAREAVAGIIEKNLWGLDIDERAAQLAYFAVMMKARQYDARFFKRNLQPHIHGFRESNNVNADYLELFGDLKPTALKLMDNFRDAMEYGSIISIKLTRNELSALRNRYDEIAANAYNNIFDSIRQVGLVTEFRPLLELAEALAQKYEAVITNPPYMGAAGMNQCLFCFVNNAYPISKSDMSTVFMEKALSMCSEKGFMSMINIPVWMFIASYEKLRDLIIRNTTLSQMVHLGRGVFGSDFGTTTFVIGKKHINEYRGSYLRLFDKQGAVDSVDTKEAWFFNRKSLFFSKQNSFLNVPGCPIAYWVSNRFISNFEGRLVKDTHFSGGRNKTHGNEEFTRLWWEISDRTRWQLYVKGGDFRRWYGNQEVVVDWSQKARDSYASHGGLYNQNFAYKDGICWTLITSAKTAFRYKIPEAHYDSGAPTIFNENFTLDLCLLGFLNSNVSTEYLALLNPTINMGNTYVLSLPYLDPKDYTVKIQSLVTENIDNSRNDWNSYENSLDFVAHPFVLANQYAKENHKGETGTPSTSIEMAYKVWQASCERRFQTLKANEEELNRIFIDIYGLQDELTPEVEDKDITVRKADLGREVRSFISYAVGCMFGRYSLDASGLIFAGVRFEDHFETLTEPVGEYLDRMMTVEHDRIKLPIDNVTECGLLNHNGEKIKLHYVPDKDGIIPITDDEYFTDDIVAYFVRFVDAVFGRETLEENLRFIASALGGKGSPREAIRSYFLNDFYADHLKIYQKRPIYWLFDSGKKNGFKALIYMHRYQPDTIARIRTDYVHEQQSRYRTAIADLENRITSASTAERVKLTKQLSKLQDQAEELRLYEEKIHHLADQMIRIDLDDGVKVNYAKFQDVLAKIK